jgi:hypothetical protein
MKRYFIFDMLVWLSCEVAYQAETCLYILGTILWENIHPCLMGICLICSSLLVLFDLQQSANFVCQHNCLMLMLQKH